MTPIKSYSRTQEKRFNVMKLHISLQEHLEQSASTHRRLTPRLVLGVRMARFACVQLGIDPALHRKKVFVYMENDHCIADGVIAVTYASPTNQLMQLLPYGKMAGTFVNLNTGQALRVREHPTSRETALALLPTATSDWQAQLDAYQFMPDDLLLCWEWVTLQALPYIPSGKHKVICEGCGEYVYEINGMVLCKPCTNNNRYKAGENIVLTLKQLEFIGR